MPNFIVFGLFLLSSLNFSFQIHVVKVRSAGAGKLIRQMEEMLFEYDELKLDEPSGSQKSTMVERESQEADDGIEDDDNWKELEEESDELCSKIR